MKTLVFTPAGRCGGIDVVYNSLIRQKDYEGEIHWLVADELYAKRRDIYKRLDMADGIKVDAFDSSLFRADRRTPLYRTLSHSYDAALRHARKLDYDLFITWQDYILAPEDGIARFQHMASKYPNTLLTGLTSISLEPGIDAVANPEGTWTVFDDFENIYEWYPPTEENMYWYDVRHRGEGYNVRSPIEWETNYGAIPWQVLNDTQVNYDPEYDYGCAYENQGYSFDAEFHGYGTVLDQGNHAISFNHKAYYREAEAEDIKHSNMQFHTDKYAKDTLE